MIIQIKAASHVTSGGSSQYGICIRIIHGCSNGFRDGCFIESSFPSHNPEQLTDRLLASANNAWFTPSGVTTFTTHGASIKHGYNNEWGHGVPDLMQHCLLLLQSNPGSFGFATPSGCRW